MRFQQMAAFASRFGPRSEGRERATPDLWREWILWSISLIGFLAGLSIAPLAFSWLWQGGHFGVILIDSLMLIWCLIIIFLFRRIHFKVLSTASVILLYAIGLCVSLSAGPLSPGTSWLFSFSMAAAILLGRRAAGIAVALNACTIGLMHWLSSHNLVAWAAEILSNHGKWVATHLVFLAANSLGTLSVAILLRGLEVAFEKVQAGHREVEREKAHISDAHGRLVAIMNGLNAIVYVSDLNTNKVLFANQSLVEQLGRNPEGEICWQAMQRGQEGPCPFCTNHRLLTPEGDPGESVYWEFQNTITGRWYALVDCAIRWVDGSLARMEIGVDITERRHADDLLKKREAELNSILRVAPTGIGVVSNRIIMRVNPKLCAMTGYREDELVGQSARILYPSQEEFDFVGKVKYNQIADEGSGMVETKWKRKDGAIRDVLLSSTPMDATDWQKGVMFTALDITERKIAELAVQAENQRRRLLMDTSGDGIAIINQDHQVVEANKRFCQMLGYDQEEALRLRTWDFEAIMPEEDIRANFADLAKISLTFETRHRRKDGSVYDVEVSAFGSVVDGQPLVVTISRDITERKLAEKVLWESEERFHDLLENIPAVAVQGYGPDGSTEYWNKASQLFYGYSREEALGRNLVDLIIPPEMADDVRAAIKSMANTGQPIPASELLLMRKDHSRIPVFSSHAVVHSPGRRPQLFCIDVDLTELKKAEAEQARLRSHLHQAQKMEAIGTLAGGIAHDFNNLLTSIIGYSEIARDDAKAGKADYQDIEQILKAAERAKMLVKQILTFSRKAETNFRPLDLNQEVFQATQMLGKTIPKMVAIQTELAADLWKVSADPSQIEQILLNMGSNASDAIGMGQGTIRIKTENRIARDQACLTCGEKFSGHYVVLEIIDTGQGMDEKALEHIFEPFFTTKEVGKGTGLGLSTVYGIVLGHRGHITCKSSLGEGTAFTIFLPALDADTEVETAELPQRNDSDLQGHGRILLVDDEEALLDLGSRQLRKAGYEVVTASSGEQALELYGDKGSVLDLVILDLSMPGMGGYKALKKLLAIDPQAKVIIASGYAANDQIKDALASGATGYVAKPFKSEELLAAVKSVLDKK